MSEDRICTAATRLTSSWAPVSRLRSDTHVSLVAVASVGCARWRFRMKSCAGKCNCFLSKLEANVGFVQAKRGLPARNVYVSAWILHVHHEPRCLKRVLKMPARIMIEHPLSPIILNFTLRATEPKPICSPVSTHSLCIHSKLSHRNKPPETRLEHPLLSTIGPDSLISAQPLAKPN